MGINQKSYHKEPEFKIEIIEYYPLIKKNKKQNFIGTMHIYLVDEEMDVRGVYVFKKEDNKYKFVMPHKYSKDLESGKNEWYPIINFTSQRKNKDLSKALYIKGTDYVKEFYEKQKQVSCPI